MTNSKRGAHMRIGHPHGNCKSAMLFRIFQSHPLDISELTIWVCITCLPTHIRPIEFGAAYKIFEREAASAIPTFVTYKKYDVVWHNPTNTRQGN